MASEAKPNVPNATNGGLSPVSEGLPPVKEDQAGEAAAEGKAAEAAMPEPKVKLSDGGQAKPEDKVDPGKEANKGDPNGVPQPQAAPVNKRPVPPPVGHYDLISELNPRCEAHVPIPLKQYPEIPWRLVLCGPGPGPSPLTHIERETGAAVLVRTIQRTIHRKPSAPVGTQTREQQITAELKRLEGALAAARKAEAAAIAAEAPPSPNVSNIPVPPSPGVSEKNENPLLAAADFRLKAGDYLGPKTIGNETPVNESPARSKAEALPKVPEDGKQNGLQVDVEKEVPVPTPEAEVDAAVQALLAKAKQAEPVKDEAGDAEDKGGLEVDKDKANAPAKQDIERADDAPIPAPPQPRTGSTPKPAASKDAKPEIGIHCWVIGATREEVNDAADACRALIEEAIQEYDDEFEDVDEESALEEIDEEEEQAGGNKVAEDLAKLRLNADVPVLESDPAGEAIKDVAAKALMV